MEGEKCGSEEKRGSAERVLEEEEKTLPVF